MGTKRLTVELMALWHGDDTVDEIATGLAIERNLVLKIWRQLKTAGLLPAGDRPRSRQSVLHRGENQADGRPSLIFDDPLLTALKEGKR